jgi:outer membrane translocation and assembly module TamA
MAATGQTIVTGDDAEEIARRLEAATNLPQILAKDPALATAGDRGLALEAERERLARILVSEGYLDATIALEWPSRAVADAAKLQVRVNPGPRYAIGAASVATTTAVDDAVMAELTSSAAGMVGKRADNATKADVSSRLVRVLGQNGYAFARVVPIDFKPTGDDATARVEIVIEPGAPSRFVSADLGSVDEPLRDEVGALLPFAPGDIYSVDALAAFREALTNHPGLAGSKVDVVRDGASGFSLSIRAKRAYALLPDTLQSSLGFGLLIAALGLLALRQTAVAGKFGALPVRILSVTTGGVLVTSAALLAVRAVSLI